MRNPQLTRLEWMTEKLRELFSLALYSLGFLALFSTILILGYQGLGYLNHGVWIDFDIERFLQQFAWSWYVKFLDWIISHSDKWVVLTKMGKWALKIPVSLITFSVGIMGWGLAAAVDPVDRFWRSK